MSNYEAFAEQHIANLRNSLSAEGSDLVEKFMPEIEYFARLLARLEYRVLAGEATESTRKALEYALTVGIPSLRAEIRYYAEETVGDFFVETLKKALGVGVEIVTAAAKNYLESMVFAEFSEKINKL